MNQQQSIKPFLHKLGGYYLVPHELLHVLAYRIIGKSCHYQWGDYSVRPGATRTRKERIFISLLPFAVCWVFGLLFHILWILSAFFIKIPPERYFIDGPTWHLIFLILGGIFILYSGTAHYDLINSYHILFGKYEPDNVSPKPHGDPNQQNEHGQDP